MSYDFDDHLAIDEQGQRATNATALVYAITDESFTTPLEITDLAGVVIPTFTSSDLAVFPRFRQAVERVVRLKSGTYIATLTSVQGLLASVVAAESAAQSAQVAAAASQTAAQAAQAAAEDAANGSTGGGTGSGVGNLVILTWDGVGTQPTRVYPAGHDLAGQDIPLPPEAYVEWRQPDFPLGVAVDGDAHVPTGD